MLLVLLLLTRAAAEWVEISQQHYRKPVRLTTTPGEPTRAFQTQKDPEQNVQNPVKKPYQDLLEDDYDVFYNKPVRDDFVTQDRPRNPTVNSHIDIELKPARVNPFLQDVSLQSPTRIPHEGFLHNPTRDIQLHEKQENPTKATYTNQSITEHNWNLNRHRLNNGRGDANIPTKVPNDNWNDNTYGPDNGDKTDEIMHKVDVSNKRKDEAVPGKIERVSNIGTVKRVELSNTPVKSPTLNNKIPEKNPNRRKNNPYEAQNYDNLSDELDIETNIFDSHEHSFSRKPNNFKPYHSSSEEVITEVDSKKRKTPFDVKVPLTSVQKHQFTHKPEKVVPIPDQNSVPDDIESTTHKVENKVSFPNSPTKPYHKFSAIQEDFPGFVTENDETIESVMVEDKNIESDKNRNKLHGKIEKVHINKDSNTEKGEDISSSGEVKVNTMENILKFMKVVADTISKNTRRGANGKIAYLNELKHSLLDNIKSRIDAAWPEEDSLGARRRSRSATPRGHVEFPSSESALMTISFLTFAVFLIKLVLQVIQTYKHKTMVMAPLVVATAGRTIANKLRANNNDDRI